MTGACLYRVEQFSRTPLAADGDVVSFRTLVEITRARHPSPAAAAGADLGTMMGGRDQRTEAGMTDGQGAGSGGDAPAAAQAAPQAAMPMAGKVELSIV